MSHNMQQEDAMHAENRDVSCVSMPSRRVRCARQRLSGEGAHALCTAIRSRRQQPTHFTPTHADERHRHVRTSRDDIPRSRVDRRDGTELHIAQHSRVGHVHNRLARAGHITTTIRVVLLFTKWRGGSAHNHRHNYRSKDEQDAPLRIGPPHGATRRSSFAAGWLARCHPLASCPVLPLPRSRQRAAHRAATVVVVLISTTVGER
jgi:hypothetical protein